MSKAQIAEMTWIAIGGILMVALVLGLTVSAILAGQAGDAEDEAIGVKTALDYSDDYGSLAARSSLHGSLYENGLNGGFYTAAPPAGTETIGGVAYVYWKRGDTTGVPSAGTITKELHAGTQALFSSHISNEGVELRTPPGAAVALDLDTSGVSGEFRAEIVDRGKAPAIRIGGDGRVAETESVAARYLRLRRVGEILTQHSSGLIDSRVHDAVRSVQDHQTNSESTCGPSSCDASLNSCGGQDRLCPGNQISGDPHAAAQSAVTSLQNDLNARFASENIRFEISVVKNAVNKVPITHVEDNSGSGTYYRWHTTETEPVETCRPATTADKCASIKGAGCLTRSKCTTESGKPTRTRECTGGKVCCLLPPETSPRVCTTAPGSTTSDCSANAAYACPCAYCANAHYDMAYQYDYTVRVSVIDSNVQLLTKDGLQNPKMVFLVEGLHVDDNACGSDGHDCGAPFASTTPLESETVNSIDWLTGVSETPTSSGEIPPELGGPEDAVWFAYNSESYACTDNIPLSAAYFHGNRTAFYEIGWSFNNDHPKTANVTATVARFDAHSCNNFASSTDIRTAAFHLGSARAGTANSGLYTIRMSASDLNAYRDGYVVKVAVDLYDSDTGARLLQNTTTGYYAVLPVPNSEYNVRWTNHSDGVAHFYKGFTQSGTWSSAAARCDADEASLATITNDEENTRAFLAAGVPSSGRYWIGATDTAAEGTWIWVTGELWSFTKWAGGPSAEDCAALIGSTTTQASYWESLGCGVPQTGFVCEK
ncbi:MAG: C-type lectin domain-containing protein [Candidatus Aenigmatarchaeota archaeon]|nr:MAG: C-type lectin domain-containing protein [Candidatus Aenigmarchaeota archaeon]